MKNLYEVAVLSRVSAPDGTTIIRDTRSFYVSADNIDTVRALTDARHDRWARKEYPYLVSLPDPTIKAVIVLVRRVDNDWE